MFSEAVKLTYFQLLSIIYLLYAIYRFFSKKKILSFENYTYEIFLTLSYQTLVVDVVMVWMSKIYPNYSIMVILNKLYMILIMGVLLSIVFYTHILTSSHNQGYVAAKDNKEKDFYLKISLYYIVAFVIVSTLIVVLPVNFLNNNLSYCVGPAINVGYVSLAFGMILIIYFLASSNRISLQKKSPFIVFIILGLIGGAIQMLNPDILIIGFIVAFTAVYVGFTIENPDLNLMEKLNITRTQAEKANNAKSDFLSSMSHEIRTPLNAIVGFSHALTEENISKDAEDEVNDIISSAHNLLEVVNNILDYSKIEANKLQIVPVEYNAVKLFKSFETYLNEKNDNPNLKIVVHIDEQLPEVLYGDSERIKQAITNLLSNAVKYTKSGSVTFDVKSITLNNICKLYISVTDTGIGIKDEEKDKVFNKFKKITSNTENFANGSGLGLTITKKLIDMMDGSINLESTFGKGTKFLISINQKVVNKTAEEINDTEKNDLTVFDASNKKVIVIDDNTVNLKVAKKLIDEYKTNTLLCKSATEFIESIKNGEDYDLVLMDDMMPGMTGSDAIKVLRNLPDYKIPTVILTANQTPEVKKQYLELGFDDYLAKPILKDELCEIMNKYLNGVVTVQKNDSVNQTNNVQPSNEVQHDRQYLIDNKFDVNKALEVLMDMETYNIALEEYYNEFDKRFTMLDQFIKDDNMKALKKEMHNLVSDSKYLGLKDLNNLANSLENELNNRNYNYISNNYPILKLEAQKTYDVIKVYLNK